MGGTMHNTLLIISFFLCNFAPVAQGTRRRAIGNVIVLETELRNDWQWRTVPNARPQLTKNRATATTKD